LLVFVGLYVAMQILHVAHESPKNVLITEHYSRNDWERSFGFYEGLTEIGFILGLAVGMVLFASSLTFSVSAIYSLYLCSVLNVVAFALAVLLITDPIMIFERRLVGIERTLDFSHRGFEGSSRLMDGLRWDGSLRQDNFGIFACAIVLFALATSIFFTPLPLYLKQVFNGQSQFVYLAYILNSVGATIGYFLIRSKARSMDIRKQMPRFILTRSLLVFALTAVVMYMIMPTVLTCVILVCLGFAYAMYYIMMISLSMEIIPQGKAGLFDGMVNLGAAIGALAGPLIAEYLSYDLVFFITAVLFLVAFFIIKFANK